ncbi:MAG TPA: Bax inhibitor-1/YccA family protein [Chloroflexia bacterium]|nr:Bax inhibitor-1/YccA family protein [Chloroflexia bacterium]
MWNNNPNNNRGDWRNRTQQNNRPGGFWGSPNNQPNGLGAWNNSRPGYAVGSTSMAERSSLSAKVMTFTFFSILAAMAGAFVGAQMNLGFGGGSWILFMIAEIGLIFATYAFKDRMPINFVLLYSFAAVTGLAISPVIKILTDAHYEGIIFQALGITAGLTLILTFYAWTTKRDFSGFAPYLFVAVIGLVLVGLLNMLFFHSPVLHMVYLYAGVVIFSFYLIFDVQQVKKFPDTVGNAVMLSIGIYLDILNLFLFILQILMSLQDNR